MSLKRLRKDFSSLVSIFLLGFAFLAIVTGLMAELLDINDFIYHKYAGYGLAIFSCLHVYLHWNQLIKYLLWRFSKKGKKKAVPQTQSPLLSPEPKPSVSKSRRFLATFSRRGFVGWVLGGLGGYVLGRGLEPDLEEVKNSDIGLLYHRWSKPGVRSFLGTLTSWGSRPPLYKTQEESRKKISLPLPGSFKGLYTEEAIQQRRSCREYSGHPMSMEELSRLLYYTGGIKGESWGNQRRSAPSSGALYPLEIYLIAHHITGLERGVYHYSVKDHGLEFLRAGDLRKEIVSIGLLQDFLGTANGVLVFTAILQRLRWKYQERSYRYALIEAGHLGQNTYLVATSMNMGACAVGAFFDDRLNKMLDLDGEEEVSIYMLSLGKI